MIGSSEIFLLLIILILLLGLIGISRLAVYIMNSDHWWTF